LSFHTSSFCKTLAPAPLPRRIFYFHHGLGFYRVPVFFSSWLFFRFYRHGDFFQLHLSCSRLYFATSPLTPRSRSFPIFSLQFFPHFTPLPGACFVDELRPPFVLTLLPLFLHPFFFSLLCAHHPRPFLWRSPFSCCGKKRSFFLTVPKYRVPASFFFEFFRFFPPLSPRRLISLEDY